MFIYGFLKTTLLDYPGHVAAAVFTGGCNFRCPYCHNRDLIAPGQTLPPIPTEEVLAHLAKRRGLLDGVCISGGEPTLVPKLEDFIREIRSMGYHVKLDTNGSKPETLISLCTKGLIDHVAMDIKHTPEKYPSACGLAKLNMADILASVDFLKNGAVPYEFRTTVVKELHTGEDMEVIGKWLHGAAAYYLQPYRNTDTVLCPGLHAPDKETLLSYAELLRHDVPNTFLRGSD